MTEKRNELLSLLENIRKTFGSETGIWKPWTDEQQEAFLEKFGCQSWISAPDEVLEVAHSKLEKSVSLWMLIHSIQRQIEADGREREVTAWAIDKQTKLLKSYDADTWFNAPEAAILKGLKMMKESASMFGYYVGDEDDNDQWDVYGEDG